MYQCSLEDKKKINDIFSNEKPEIVVNLAAQAGVRYSIKNPDAYISSNIVGFSNLPSYVSSHASFALSNNFINLISDFYDNEKKSFNLNLEDEILQSATVVSAGKILKKEFD